MKRRRLLEFSLVTSVAIFQLGNASAEQVRIAFIDPLSGPFAPVGQNALNSWKAVAEKANAEAWTKGRTFEIAGFDNKGSPQESLAVLKTVVEQGYRYVAQGVGSGVALALTDAITKHNERNPGKEIVFLNYAANDPDLTNAKCSFWHFRFDASSDMKMEALISHIAADSKLKSVYLINQNFAFGHQVAKASKELLKRKRPDVQVAGDDLHPIGQVKDFSPYIAKIRASGAQAVITGNFGTDLALLIRAAKDAGLDVAFYTIYGATSGVPRAVGAAGTTRISYVGQWNANNEGFVGQDIVQAFRKKYNDDYTGAATYAALALLSKAIAQAGTTDPVRVAFALEDAGTRALNGEVRMRKSDHQIQQPLYVASWTKTNGKDIRFDQEETGYGWKTVQKIGATEVEQPTSCTMKRPTL